MPGRTTLIFIYESRATNLSNKQTKNKKRFNYRIQNNQKLDLGTIGLQIKLLGRDEKFVSIVGFPDYWISNYGRAISHKRNKCNLLRPQLNGSGYLQYSLCRAKIVEQIAAHRLVAEAFCKGFDPDFRNEAHHRNHVKTDNYYKNLMWVNKIHHSYLDRNCELYFMNNYCNSEFTPIQDLVNIADKIGVDLRLISYKLKEKPDEVIGDMEVYTFDSDGKFDYYIGIIRPQSNMSGGAA